MSAHTPTDARGYDDPEVLAAIAAWMPTTRWYPLKGQQVDVQLEHAYDLGDAAILLLRAGDTLLQVPVTWHDERSPAAIAQIGDRWLVDACFDPGVVQVLVDIAAGKHTVEGLAGDTTSEPAPAEHIHVVTGEQSNTSVIGGTGTPDAPAWIAKVFRVVSPGDNPDVVVTGALTRAGCVDVPKLLASITATWTAGEASVTGHLLAISELVPDAQDAWDLYRLHALATLRGESRELPDTRALGATVASVHRSLADAMGTTEAQQPETRGFVTGLEQRLEWARQEAAEVLADIDDDLAAELQRLREIEAIGQLQQIHGDLHLGQVLRSGDGGWRLLDFEGEPLRPMHERMVREPRMRDIVGMLRSFDYAAGSALQQEPDADPAIAGDWVHARQTEFLEGYGEALEPVDPQNPIYRALLLDKALYEVVYELRNRPTWLPVPLAAVKAILRPVG